MNYYEPRNVFENIDSKEEFIQVAAGATHNAALTSNGELYTWGDQSDFCQARPFVFDANSK